MSHTPGPWATDLKISSQAGRVVIEPDIAIVYVQPSRYDETVSKARLANARLISAAPEMLECLQRLIAVHDSGYTPGEALIEQLRQVTQKAIGAEQ
jgi:hypothetical protein